MKVIAENISQIKDKHQLMEYINNRINTLIDEGITDLSGLELDIAVNIANSDTRNLRMAYIRYDEDGFSVEGGVTDDDKEYVYNYRNSQYLINGYREEVIEDILAGPGDDYEYI